MNSSIKQYSIIETQDNNGQTITSVVPTKWISDDFVLCPQNPKEESKAVKAYVDPDSVTWKILSCTVRKTYDSYKKAREMLPMAEDTDGLDTEKETGRGKRKKKKNLLFNDSDDDDNDDDEEEEKEKEKNHTRISKGKALPRPPKSNYKKNLQIRNSSSVRNALQRLKNQRVTKKLRRIDERSDTEEEMVDDNVEVPKKCSAEDINMELEKARKRIQERIKKARHEKETEAHVRENPGVIDKENERPSDQYDMNVQSERNLPDLSLVIPPPIDEVDNTDDVTSVTTCQPRQRPVSALALDPKSSTFSRSSSVSSNQSVTFSRSSSLASNQSATFSRSSSVASNKPPVTTSPALNVQKILTALSTAKESNLDQDISSSSAGFAIWIYVGFNFLFTGVLVLKAVLSKQEELSRNFQNVDHKLNLIMDLVRTAENVKKPEGWPTLPLRDMNSFYEWELFLQNGDNYDFAVSHFSVVAGRGVHEGEMATSICKKIFSPEVASQLNWTGTEIKKGIKSLKCGTCIIDACGKQYKGNFSRSKVTGSISTWLRSNSKRRAINNVDLPR